MNTMSSALALPGRLPGTIAFREIFRREPRFAGAALVLVIAMAPTLLAMGLDLRQFNGINIWDKVFKFQVALFLYLATLAVYARWLPAAMTGSRWYKAFSWVVVGSVMLEIIWVGGAAANGIGSHFNVQGIMAAIYGLMGVLAVTLTSGSLILGIGLARDQNSALAPAFRLSLVLGLILTFVLTLIVAGYMSSSTGHWVAGSGTDATGLAVMGWARDGGDLRVAHFFGTHALHFIPIAGFVASRTLAQASANALVWGASALYVALVAATFLQALAGQPFLGFL